MAETRLQSLEKSREINSEEWIREKRELEAENNRLEGDREGVLASVPEDDLEIYKKLRQRYTGRVVALVEEGNCSLCGLSIPGSLQQTIKSGTELIQCGQCARVLYAG
jgi:predicted  nucleic acid-binding Zn-ribbon protein